MKFKSKKLFSTMLGIMATTYAVESVSEHFSVSPTVEQELQDAIQLSVDFMQKINVMPVDQIKGEKVLGSANAVVPKRTDTEAGSRQTTSVVSLGGKTYECHFTEYDVHIKYVTMDSWAKFKNFNQKYGEWVRKAIALAKLRLGWLGTSAAEFTNPANNGLDANKGWLQHLREYESGSHWYLGEDDGSGGKHIRVGDGGDFANLDNLVFQVRQMVHENYRDGGDLVAIIGPELLADDKVRLYESMGGKPTEKEKIDHQEVTSVYGGCPVVSGVPHFPARGILVTSLDNLSIYYQSESVRRAVKDNPERNRVDDFNSSNDAYVIEDEEKAAGLEFANVKIKNKAGAWV